MEKKSGAGLEVESKRRVEMFFLGEGILREQRGRGGGGRGEDHHRRGQDQTNLQDGPRDNKPDIL